MRACAKAKPHPTLPRTHRAASTPGVPRPARHDTCRAHPQYLPRASVAPPLRPAKRRVHVYAAFTSRRESVQSVLSDWTTKA